MPSGEPILLVEDDPGVSATLRDFLERGGYSVEVATTGAQALTALDAAPVALVLLDLLLPDANGAGLLPRIRRSPEAPDVIVITGYPELESAIIALESGAAGYLKKPIDLPRLGELVGSVLRRRRLASDNARLTTQMAERLRETQTLLAISSALTSTLDVGEALRRTCRELARLTGADTVSVHLHDRDADQLVPTAAYHVPKEHLQILAATPIPLTAQGFYSAVWRERQPVQTDDVAGDPRFSDGLFRLFTHQSGLLLPLVLDGDVAGAFYLVWWTARRRFTEDELTVLQGICGQVTLLLRNARLFDRSERDRRRLKILNDVARHLAAVHDPERVLSLIVDEAARLLGAEAAVLRLLDGDELAVAARTKLAEELIFRARLKPGIGFSGRIMTSGTPLVLGDLAAGEPIDREFVGALLDRGFHLFVGVPLTVDTQVVGTLNVYGRRPRTVHADEVALLRTFADQASLAIDKATLLARAEKARNVLAGLHRIGTAMQLSWDRDRRVEAFIEGAHDVLGFDRIYVMLATPDGAALELVRSYGETTDAPVVVALTADAGVLHEVFRTRRPAAVLTADDLARVPPLHVRHRGRPHFRSTRFLAWPLVVGERPIGVAVADNKPSRRPIDPATLEPFGLLCHQFAAALEEARLYADASAREREATKFYEITSELAGSLDLDRVLDLIVQQSLDILRCDASAIFRYDPSLGGLTILRGRGQDPVLTRDLVLRPGEGVAGVAYRDRRAVWTRDRLQDTDLRYSASADVLVSVRAPRAYLAVPIVSRDEVFGVLMGFFFTPHDFTPKEIQLLDTLAHHAAITLQNSRLFSEAHTQRMRLSQIFDSTSDGVGLIDRAGRVLSANGHLAELLGAPTPEGTDFPGLLAQLGAREADLKSFLATGGRHGQGDLPFPRSMRVLHWVAQPTTDSAGERIGFTLTVRDVTQEREVSQMKSDFVSFVTHQLRTPLTGIRWMLDLAGREPDVSPSLQEFIADASTAAQRLIGLVNDLLDVSKLEGAALALDLRPTRLDHVTKEVLGELDVLVRDKQQRLAFDGGPTVPPVLADPQWLRQVILNLTSNAIKYTPGGGRIAIQMRVVAGAAEWAITDSGIGVPPEAQRRLFEKFYRAENAAALETEGTGLGLYLVRLIVERSGGRVWHAAAPEGGSTFCFTLPLAEPGS